MIAPRARECSSYDHVTIGFNKVWFEGVVLINDWDASRSSARGQQKQDDGAHRRAERLLVPCWDYYSTKTYTDHGRGCDLAMFKTLLESRVSHRMAQYQSSDVLLIF